MKCGAREKGKKCKCQEFVVGNEWNDICANPKCGHSAQCHGKNGVDRETAQRLKKREIDEREFNKAVKRELLEPNKVCHGDKATCCEVRFQNVFEFASGLFSLFVNMTASLTACSLVFTTAIGSCGGQQDQSVVDRVEAVCIRDVGWREPLCWCFSAMVSAKGTVANGVPRL